MGKGPLWYVYVLLCADSTLYCGITTNIDRRVEEHNHPKKAAKYTRVRQPVRLVYREGVETRSLALKREWEIKQLSREQKLSLIDKQ